MIEGILDRLWTNEEIELNLMTLPQDCIAGYVSLIGSERMKDYTISLLSRTKLPNYAPCSDGPCTC